MNDDNERPSKIILLRTSDSFPTPAISEHGIDNDSSSHRRVILRRTPPYLVENGDYEDNAATSLNIINPTFD